jgi:hypothetical protein
MTLQTKQVASEHPDAVRRVAERCDEPLQSKLLSIAEEVDDA